MALATGIEKKLNKAAKKAKKVKKVHDPYNLPFRYMSLRPAWSDATETEVIFWLNPINQELANAGWFTVKDLEQWLTGKGPVPKQNIS